MTADVEDLVWTRKEAAESRLKVSVRTLYNLTRAGVIPVVAIGARRLYRESDLRAYIDSLEPVQVPSSKAA